MKLNKEKVDEILKKSHLIINEATGIDISKTQKEAAKRESRKILKELKEIDLEVYNIVKEEFNG
tara:strand:+ start:4626 stop:4817 length:192 start_codon:yes stop_codon:yes gene_type:complete